MKLSKESLALGALLLSAAIWGASTPIAKAILTEIPPFSLAFFRFALASVILFALSVKLNRHTPIHQKDLPQLILIGLFAITLNIGFGFVGITYTTALDSIIFASITPIAIAAASTYFLGERFTKVNFVGQLLAVAGALIVVNSPTGDTSNRLLGDILLIGSGAAWVTSVILSKEIFRKYHSFTITSFIFLVGTVTFAPLALWEYLANPAWVTAASTNSWLGVVFQAIFTSVVAYLAFEWGLERSSATFAGLVEHFQLLVGAVLAGILLGEILSSGFVIGAGLILVGIVLATRPAHHYRKSHAR